MLSIPFTAFMTALLNEGNIDTAWRLFLSMKDAPLAPDAYWAMIRGLAYQAVATSVHAAEELLSEMVTNFCNQVLNGEVYGRSSLPFKISTVHNAVKNELVGIGEPERAKKYFE